MATEKRYTIKYVIDGEEWNAHNVWPEMVDIELDRIQYIENGTVISLARER